jgi:hypothetical protein
MANSRCLATLPDRLLEAPCHTTQHHPHRSAAQMRRAQSGGKRLAVHARQLALESRLQILRGSRRPLLRRLEQAHRSALEDHVHRATPLGPRVLIKGIWYKCITGACEFYVNLILRPQLFSENEPPQTLDAKAMIEYNAMSCVATF